MPIYDELGLAKEKGATDNLDSSRMSSMVVLSGLNKNIDLSLYVIPGGYTRHPLTDPNKMLISRDQIVPLFAGFYYQGETQLVNELYDPPNGDIISPSVRGHFKRCAGLKSNIIEDVWLWFDVAYSAFIDPLAEPNQLIAMLLVADHKYLRTWTKWNKSWRRSIDKYWCTEDGAWRGEPELAAAIKLRIEYITDAR